MAIKARIWRLARRAGCARRCGQPPWPASSCRSTAPACAGPSAAPICGCSTPASARGRGRNRCRHASPTAWMPAMAQMSSISLASPVTPMAPITSPSLVADQLAAAFEKQRIVGEVVDRLHEQRLVVGLLQDELRRPPQRQRSIGFAVTDLETQHRGAILFLERLHPTAGIEHDGAHRPAALLLCRSESRRNDGVGLIEAQRAHSIVPLPARPAILSSRIDFMAAQAIRHDAPLP